MRALVFNEKLEFRTDHPVPDIAEHDALVKVTYAGICNTDLEITKGYMNFQGIPGHEFVGVVEKSGKKEIEGKRVAGEINVACGTCDFCKRNLQRHCRNRSVLGILGKNGVFADYTTLPISNLHLLPDSISDQEAVFIEPLAAAYEILEQINIVPDHKVCVLGDGKLGLLIAQVISLTDCNLIAVGNHSEKLSILDEIGIKTRLASSFNDEGFDIVIDCTGSTTGLKTALRIVRPRGVVVLKTTVARKNIVDLTSIVVNEITLIGSRCGPFLPAIKAIESRNIDLYPLISREFSIEEGVQAFQYAARKDVMKVMFRMS